MEPGTAFVGTFHKTGTVLLGKIFRGLDRKGLLQLWRSDRHPEEPRSWDIRFHHASAFVLGGNLATLPETAKVVISVRDPRDLVVSAVRYHQDAQEAWLHQPQARFGGKTYQAVLTGLATMEEKMLFEMKHSSGNVIRNMVAVPWADSRIMRVKLEDLMQDRDLVHFETLFRHLGMSGDMLDVALAMARRKSLFNNPGQAHVRGGYAQEWRQKFPAPVLAAFEEMFPDAPGVLGYA